MQAPVLTLTDIRKSFGGVRALDGVDLELHRGSITALLGENGAGKSTLVKILCGVHQPDSGAIHLGGTATRIPTPTAARNLGIGVVHQECLVFDHMTVAENLFVNAHPRRRGLVDWSLLHSRAQAALDELGADFEAQTPVAALSIAQKHVVQIARALVNDSRVLILDEPTASLSRRECAELFRIARKLRDAGCALLFITHRFEEIFELADRFAVFRDGASVGAGALAGTQRDELIRLMVGRPIEQLFPKQVVQPGEVLLRVEDLGRDGEFENISFSLRRGEILGIYGLVGAGRSELAQVLFGVQPAHHGRVSGSADIALVPEDRQSQGSILPFSVAANIALPNLTRLAPRGWLPARREHALAREWITALAIKTEGPAQPVQNLSGGNQQKVVLAKWLARKPAVLILDEPTKGIDVGAKAAVHAVTSEFASAGNGVILISSELPEITAMSDRVLVMRRGRLRGEFARTASDQRGAAARRQRRMNELANRAWSEVARRDFKLALLTLALFVAVVLVFPGFAAPRNLAGVLDDTAILIMLALGQMLVILVRGVDLSVAANLALCGMLAALFNRMFPAAGILPVLSITAVAGGLLGAFNGILVWKLRLPPIVVTLGTMSIYRGVIYLLSRGAWVNENEMSREFLAFPRAHFLGLYDARLAGVDMRSAVHRRAAASAGGAQPVRGGRQSRKPRRIRASTRGACSSWRTRYAARSRASRDTCGWRASRWRIRTSRWASNCR